MASTAALSFERTLTALGVDPTGDEAEQLGRRGALLIASELSREQRLNIQLRAPHVAELLELDLEEVNERQLHMGLIALRADDGSLTYPAFQFHPLILARMPELLELLVPAVGAMEKIVSFLIVSAPELGGASPASWLSSGRNADPVVEHARRYAAGL